MDLPEQLDDWRYETIVALLNHHEFEPGGYNYKEVLTATGPGREKALSSLRRTVCSMANTDGGYVLFGVQDRQHRVASPTDRIVGIPLGGDLRKEFGDKIVDLQPEVYFEVAPHPFPVPNDQARGIFVVRVPLSPMRPHMVRSTGVFYHRGQGGTAVPMGYYEVREQMMFTEERLRRLTLLRLQLAMFRDVITLIEGERAGMLDALDRFETDTYGGLLSDLTVLLPDSPPLLQQLLRIPTLARRINVGLDRYQAKTAGPAFSAERVRAALTELWNLINTCQIELEERFGPIHK